jgi:serine/threonine-protein kinase RsbW
MSALRAPDQPVKPALVRRWPNTPVSVARARHALHEVLITWGLPNEVVEAAVVVLTELVGNAVKHASAGDRLAGELIETRCMPTPDGLRIEVHDADENRPQMRMAADDDEGGRGLALVDMLTWHRWGVTPRDLRGGQGSVGKIVYAIVGADSTSN